MKKSPKVYKVIQSTLLVLLFVGVVVIAIFQFDNRNLKCRFITAEGEEYEVLYTNLQIANGECAQIILRGIPEGTVITKFSIYGNIRSMVLEELLATNLYYYIADADASGVALTEKGLVLNRSGDVTFYMTQEDGFVEHMQNLSSSILEERIILAGLWTCAILFLVIVNVAIRDWKDETNYDNHSPVYEFRKFIKDMSKYGQYMVYSAQTDLKAEVANSYLNRLWWLLEPLFSMLVYVIVFGNIMGNNIENYATFVFSALLMWTFFSKTLNYSVKLVRNNKDIVSKVYVPKFILLFSNMILNLYKLLFSLIVLVPMLVIFHVHIGIQVLWVIPAYAVLILFSFGAGMILLHFGVYVDDLSYAVGILLNMMMFLSGVFYDVMTGLPAPLNTIMLCANPVALCVDSMRKALLYNQAANLPLIGVWLIASILLCWLGVHTVYKNENSYVKIV